MKELFRQDLHHQGNQELQELQGPTDPVRIVQWTPQALKWDMCYTQFEFGEPEIDFVWQGAYNLFDIYSTSLLGVCGLSWILSLAKTCELQKTPKKLQGVDWEFFRIGVRSIDMILEL